MNRNTYLTYLSIFILTSSLVQAKMIQVSDEETYNQALRSNQRLVVEFSADWCSVCNNIKKPFEEIANEAEFGNVAFIQVDVDKLDSISKQNGVVGVPTFVYLEKGDKKVEEIGVQNLPAFKDHLRDNVRKTFQFAQNDKGDAELGQMEPIMADIVEQDVIVEDQPMQEEPNFLTRIVEGITSFFVFIFSKIKEFFSMIVDAISGLFG